jgi:hypothetical protein
MNSINNLPFAIHPQVDSTIHDRLFENDCLYIEEIFKIPVEHFDEDIDLLKI